MTPQEYDKLVGRAALSFGLTYIVCLLTGVTLLAGVVYVVKEWIL
jgi:hypothetical protein